MQVPNQLVFVENGTIRWKILPASAKPDQVANPTSCRQSGQNWGPEKQALLSGLPVRVILLTIFPNVRLPVRFCLVDRITDLEAGVSISAVKNLTSGEEYLADHFPGFPIMPGVMMVESLVQTGSWLMRYTESFTYSTVLLKEARAVRFSNFVKPGQTLRIECKIHKRDEQQYVLKCAGTVDGEPAVSARLTLEQFNLSDHQLEMANTDRRIVEQLRDHFDSIWTPITQPR